MKRTYLCSFSALLILLETCSSFLSEGVPTRAHRPIGTRPAPRPAAAVGQVLKYPDPVCAVKGSTVTLPCSFTPVAQIKILRVVWCANHLICHGSTPSVYDSESENNDPRYRYLGDKSSNCTLQITDLQKGDNATFRFRMETSNIKATFTGTQGVRVSVIEGARMKISSSSSEPEADRGEAVTLLCSAVCTFHQLELTWFRDGHALSETGPALQLGPLTAEHSGNYTCGLKGNELTVSRPYSLQVEAAHAGGAGLSVVGGVGGGVLLLLFTLILVSCFIKRKRAAAAEQQEHTPSDNVYSAVAPEPQRGGAPQEVTVEDVSYASVHFKQQQQDRLQREAEDAVIYSSVASRG